MLSLSCGQDLTVLKIKTYDGINLSAFLEHLATCDNCRRHEKELIGQLNGLIGGEKG